MSEIRCAGRDSGAVDNENGSAAAIGAAGFLSLAAAPTFALMALLTAAPGSGSPDALCGASPLSGMVSMYLLMSAFHLAPWLKLISARRGLPSLH